MLQGSVKMTGDEPERGVKKRKTTNGRKEKDQKDVKSSQKAEKQKKKAKKSDGKNQQAEKEGKQKKSDASGESTAAADENVKRVPGATAEEKPVDFVKPCKSFEKMGLETRVLRACQALEFSKPTPVQASVIPAAMTGRDILATAPTGSGKTAAFLVPVVNSLVTSETYGDGNVRAIILVPTRELAFQVSSVARKLLKYVPQVTVRTIVTKNSGVSQTTGDILVATPSALAEMTRSATPQTFEHVSFIVVDEADLVLSYGYDEETRQSLSLIPPSAQSMLVSATLGEEVDALKKVVLRKPMLIKITLEDGDEASSQITHNFTILKRATDKYLVTYALLRLKVLTGKTLIFTNDVDTAFKLKLFLDKFAIRSATLNAELPFNSRVHCVEQFNAGIFDVLIACDEDALKAATSASKKRSSSTMAKSKGKPMLSKENEYGLSRGIDFHEVSTVLNFDSPYHGNAYLHRAGRTARAGRTGTVLSLVTDGQDKQNLEKTCKSLGIQVDKLIMKMEELEAFRYRVEDCLRSITGAMVLEARLKDVKREMLASEKLRDFFDSNPTDLEALRHEKSLTSRVQPHLAELPAYLLPRQLREKANSKTTRRKGHRVKRGSASGVDPLDSAGKKQRGYASSRERYRNRKGIAKKPRGPRKKGQ